MKSALITGVTGQDGSYLAELLLDRGYEVHGLIRRASSFNTQRLDEIYRDPHESGVRFLMHYGDLSDSGSLVNLIRELRPDEIYHLGAQSHVKVSFDIPEYTADATGMGTIRMLEAIRASGVATRFYQASSSEMFGLSPAPQSEETPFHPRSPYGVSKVFAYWATVNYREAYGMFATNGILFNHECVPEATPVAIRRHGFIDIVPIGEVVPHRQDPSKGKCYTSDGGEFEVWDGDRWARCLARTATWHDEEVVTLHGRGGIVTATEDHVVLTQDGDRPAGTLVGGERLVLGDQPDQGFPTVLTEVEAWLLGVLVAEGYISPEGAGRITCSDEMLLTAAEECWSQVAGGYGVKGPGPASAFGPNRTAVLNLCGNSAYLRMLRDELYTRDGKKKVPKRVLNAAPSVQLAFLTGYNLGDGLWAGGGNDMFKSFRTSSPVLAAGLVWLARTSLGRRVSVYLQPNHSGIGSSSYLMNLSSSLRSGKGKHLQRPQEDVRRVERSSYKGWMCDLATETGKFAAGVGFPVIHNSPRRGETFVTRKITRAVARIQAGIQDKLFLGNLDAVRDWGYAPEYVEAMWMMAQHDEPLDLVIATGVGHTVREFAELAFKQVDLDWERYVEVDRNYERPAEVFELRGDASKAERLLGWKPKVGFEDLVKIMVDADVQLLEDELSGRLVRQDRDH